MVQRIGDYMRKSDETPQIKQTSVDTTKPQNPEAPSEAAKLPHERDQSPDAVGHAPQPAIEQAAKDLKKGLVDTDARGKDGRPQHDQ